MLLDPQKQTTVLARRWDSSRSALYPVVSGPTLQTIVREAIQNLRAEGYYTDNQVAALSMFARCRVDGIEIKRSQWADTRPHEGARIEVLQGVKGGGGGGNGKNPVATVLSVVVIAAAAAATWYIGGTGSVGAISALGYGSFAGGLAGAAVMMGGMLAVNALFPVSQPSLGAVSTGDLAKDSPTYSITGSRNAANPLGYVPLVLGKHRHTPPLGAKSWTKWEGPDQYFNMLVIWGHAGVTVTDKRIDKTPLENFKGMTEHFHASTYGDDLTLFGKSYNEQSVGASLKASDGWVTRTIGECEDISVDIAANAMCELDKGSGAPRTRTVQFQLQYATVGQENWTNFGGSGSSEYVEFSAATRASVVRNYRAEGLTKANRKARMRRITGDSDSQYILDECTWSTARAILNQPAFNSPVPLCVSELRIKANEQLSGYVDDFNGLCESVMPAWNGSAWVNAPTSNPAAHMRYLLTSRAGLQEPYSLAKLDDATLVELYEYADANGYEFNFIADTEQNVWSRLVQVLAPARAAPTTDVDALWGVVIDNADKEPTQMFTPRNSWGWKVNKTMPRLPHALRVKFVDETQDYAQVEQFVYMDGYSVDGAGGTEKATYIIEWDYAGVTSWPQLYALAREHMARLMHRAHSVTLNTDWEWMATRRGKLVRAYSDILMNTFPNGGAARVERLVYDIDGVEVAVGREADIPTDEHGVPLIPIGMQLDDTLIFNEPAPARYGVSVRDEHSRVTVYEIVPEYGEEEHDTIYFKYAISAANVPPLRSLCTVALLEGENYADYLVVSMEHGDNNSAEITLIPWAIGPIKAAASGPIPPYNPSIILDVAKGSSLPTPIIRDVRSDESVLIRAASGGSTPRIAAWWELGVSTVSATNLNFQLMATDVETGASVFGSAPSFEDYVAAIGVEEKCLYDVRVRALDPATGKTSAWSTPIRHAVIGRTTPPPPPDAVNLDGFTLRITQSNRPLDVVGHVVTMVFDETDTIEMGRVLTDPYTTTGSFDLKPWAGRARRVFVQTIDELGLLSAAVSIAINLGDVLPDNVLFTISERERGWPGTTVNAYIDEWILRAQETALLWPQDDDAPLWPQDDSFPLWNSGAGLQMSYVWQVTSPAAYAGARVLVNPVATSGKLLSIEYRLTIDELLWPQDDNALLWPQDDDAPLWPQGTKTEWMPFPENYVTHGYETLEFRVVYADGDPAALTDIEVILDVEDRDWAVNNLEIADNGSTHIPLPLNTFRAVTNVQGTLQYFTGSTAMTLEHVPGTETVGENGFLEIGPVIQALNNSRALTLGKANIVVKGY